MEVDNLPQQTPPENQVSQPSPPPKRTKLIIFGIVIFAILIMLGVGIFLYFQKSSLSTGTTSSTQNNPATNQTTNNITTGKFAHFAYLPKPQFEKATASSFASPDQYNLSKPLPSAEEIINKSKTSFLFVNSVYAGGDVRLPVYRTKYHSPTAEEALILGKNFGFTDSPQQGGFKDLGLYDYEWDNATGHFSVFGNPKDGSFDYYLKGTTLAGSLPSDDDAIAKAKEFLTTRGISIDDTYIANILGNVGDRSRLSGFREDHKQVYFRKKIDGYPIYTWGPVSSTPKTDLIEVWVGSGGRIISAQYINTFWTDIDSTNKTDYLLKEPSVAYDDIKAGKGKVAWMDIEGVATGGFGPTPPTVDWQLHGQLRNVSIGDVQIAYYHEQRPIDEPEFYQPIYLFTATAIFDWKSDYNAQGAELDLKGRKANVVFVVPAVSEYSFFENPTTILAGTPEKIVSPPPPPPVYYPPVVPSPTPIPTNIPSVTTPPAPPAKQSFILKLGVVTDLSDPKRNIVLSWEDVPGTVKYNVYLKIAGDASYADAAVEGTGSLSTTLGVNKYIDYTFKIKACSSADSCIESNEVSLPQEQKPTFYVKLGVITPGEDPKESIVLSWSEIPGTVKYNVFLRNSPTEEYGAALAGVGDLSYTASVNRHNDNYFIIQACNNDTCYPSNEILVPKQ